ncbi:MAG TPA: 3-isopropylmalate dehydratase large subunit [Desulfonatronum sp.]|nr:3-isopropylmalate dehydratase large subunit [Desulfonatronum sp.]
MPQTLAEKLLARSNDQGDVHAGRIVQCPVSLVLANDITAPFAIKSFEAMGAIKVFDPEKVVLVCDHFTPNKDIDSAQQVKVVRDFAKRAGIVHFYDGGESGVEHALLPELGLVGPGDVVVGADSHTCTYGGLGAFATGMGSTDVAGAMVLGETWFKVPATIRVEFSGIMPAYLEAKDLILLVIGKIGVAGATYKALEFGGTVIEAMEVEGRMTMANMAIEAGGKAGLFAADAKTLAYARAAGRTDNQEITPDPGAVYERELRFDVSGLSPLVACPHLPENVKPVEAVQNEVVDQVVIGSCTNGRISDLRRAAEVLKGRKAAKGLRLIILPATPRVYKQALREGLLEIFMDAGAVIGPPTCGPCLGGHMGILASGEKVLATTNRNFKGRMGSLDSEVYLAGAGVAAATAVAGHICHPGKI